MPQTKTAEQEAREAELRLKIGQLDLKCPIQTNFGNRQINMWIAALRDGDKPPSHIVDQLNADGWDVLDVELVGSNVPPNVFVRVVSSLTLSRSTLSRAIDYRWAQREGGITADLMTKPPSSHWSTATRQTVQITSKVSSMFRGLLEEREIWLFVSHISGKPCQMIVAR